MSISLLVGDVINQIDSGDDVQRTFSVIVDKGHLEAPKQLCEDRQFRMAMHNAKIKRRDVTYLVPGRIPFEGAMKKNIFMNIIFIFFFTLKQGFFYLSKR